VTVAPNLTFIDTNILVYAYDADEGAKHRRVVEILDELWESGTGALSTQVLQEFYSVVTRRKKMSRELARQRIASYGEWCVVRTNPELLVMASLLEERNQLQWWDALVIEAALRSGATTLLSEDLQHGQQFGTLTVRNPFVEGN
jgi:predicted nucleic acid-binding protein